MKMWHGSLALSSNPGSSFQILSRFFSKAARGMESLGLRLALLPDPSVCHFYCKQHMLGSEVWEQSRLVLWQLLALFPGLLQLQFWIACTMQKWSLYRCCAEHSSSNNISFKVVVERWGLGYLMQQKHAMPVLLGRQHICHQRQHLCIGNHSDQAAGLLIHLLLLLSFMRRTPFGREYELTACTKFNTHKAEDVDNYFMIITGDPREVAPSLS